VFRGKGFWGSTQGRSFSEGEVEMIRCLVWVLVCMGCSAAAWAAPEQKAGAGPVCLYESKAYSEGTYVCVQKSLMLTCASDGTRAIWKPVVDKDVNDRCTAPMTLHYPAQPLVHSHRRHAVVHRPRPAADFSAKCFTFNGRQYCE
jgi:hypothetical protein